MTTSQDRLVDDAVGRWDEHDLPVAGRVLDVVRAPAAVLATAGAEVDPTAPDVVRLAADLVATMRVSPGCVGLAAPQVGVGAKVFCVDVTEHPKTRSHHGTFVLCNAVVAGVLAQREGPRGLHERPRPDRGREAGHPARRTRRAAGHRERVELTADAFEARALQHEIDHCDGLLFLDRAAGAHAIHPRKTYL